MAWLTPTWLVPPPFILRPDNKPASISSAFITHLSEEECLAIKGTQVAKGTIVEGYSHILYQWPGDNGEIYSIEVEFVEQQIDRTLKVRVKVLADGITLGFQSINMNMSEGAVIDVLDTDSSFSMLLSGRGNTARWETINIQLWMSGFIIEG